MSSAPSTSLSVVGAPEFKGHGTEHMLAMMLSRDATIVGYPDGIVAASVTANSRFAHVHAMPDGPLTGGLPSLELFVNVAAVAEACRLRRRPCLAV